MTYLVFDSEISGHHPEYIVHLVNHLVEHKSENCYYFVVPEEFNVRFPDVINKSIACACIKWEFIPTDTIQKIHKLSLLKRSFVELDLVKKYAENLAAQEVYLLYFNIFQIALIFKRTGFKIKGILFMQFSRMSKGNFSNTLKYYRKYFTTKLYTLNSKIKEVFILNDQVTVDYLNSEFKTDIFTMLPDPIPVYEEEVGFDLYDYYKIPRNKKILLHPGAIDPRKGTYEIIEAVDFLGDKETNVYAILIVGKATPGIAETIFEKLDAVKSKKFTIVFDNQFVTNERLKSLFLQSFAILMPYKNPEGSSGILGHAAAANKCILAPDSGLIKDIVETYKLGVLVNDSTSKGVAKAIEQMSDYVLDITLSVEYVSKHSVAAFSSSLFGQDLKH